MTFDEKYKMKKTGEKPDLSTPAASGSMGFNDKYRYLKTGEKPKSVLESAPNMPAPSDNLRTIIVQRESSFSMGNLFGIYMLSSLLSDHSAHLSESDRYWIEKRIEESNKKKASCGTGTYFNPATDSCEVGTAPEGLEAEKQATIPPPEEKKSGGFLTGTLVVGLLGGAGYLFYRSRRGKFAG